jgi:hypothetical protein
MFENEVELNGKTYVLKSSIIITKPVKVSKKGMRYCVIRTYSAGVFAGWIHRKNKGQEATIYDSRRLWYWKGANSLSQLANDGVANPTECQFAQVVRETDLKQIIEIIPISEKGKLSIDEVKIWQI